MQTPVILPASELDLEHLYRTYRNAIYGVCYAYTRSRDEAHDLVQETFVKAYQGLGGFEGRSHPKTWLTRIAINQSLTRVIANKRVQRNLSAYLEDAAREKDIYAEDASGLKLGMEEVLKTADVTTRKVLLLYFLQGLTHAEIATTLGVSRVAVTRRISRFKELANPTEAKAGKAREAGKVPIGLKMVRDGKWAPETGAYRKKPEPRMQVAMMA